MIKKIRCTGCGRDCGEIREASLLKGLKFICNPCNLKLDRGGVSDSQIDSFYKLHEKIFNRNY